MANDTPTCGANSPNLMPLTVPPRLTPETAPAVVLDLLQACLQAADEWHLFAVLVRHPTAIRSLPVELQLLTFGAQLCHRQGDLAPVPLARVAMHDGDSQQPRFSNVDLAVPLQPRFQS